MSIGNVIAQERKRLGLTQESLAQTLGVTNQAVSKWETDQSVPDTMLLPALADVLDVSLDALFGREIKEPEEAPVSVPDLPWENDDAFHVVLYCGHTLVGENPVKDRVHFCYEGPAKDIYSDFSVECGDVDGSVNAGSYVECCNVGKGVNAGGYVECQAVSGGVIAGTYVECGNVGDRVTAGTYVECGDVNGDVAAGGYVECGNIANAVDAGMYTESEFYVNDDMANSIEREVNQLVNDTLSSIGNSFRRFRKK